MAVSTELVYNVRLHSAIAESGLAFEDVARRAGVDPKTLERWVAGRTPHPRNRMALAIALQVTVHELWPETASTGGRGARSSLAGIESAYATRSDFLTGMPPEALFGRARSITSVGLSNNLLCQNYADKRLEQLLLLGTTVRCLFLDPAGEGTAAREREEHYEPGHLSNLTALNISLLRRLRARLPEEAQARLHLATYDQTIRFNVLVVERDEGTIAVVQPYLPHARGGDSPTLVVRRSPEQPGLFETFDQVVMELIDASTPC